MSETVQEKRKRERSPSYPAVNLEEALARARKLYDEERRNAAPVNTILKHWGYSAGSGGGLRVLAALEKFGLTSDEGSGPNRKARLTEDAYNILIDNRPDSQDRQRLIQQAALGPAVHSDLWEQYAAEMPSDSTLRFELRKKGFTEAAATELIDEYKATLAFAKLGEAATLADKPEDKPKDDPFMAATQLETLPAAPKQRSPGLPGEIPQTRVVQIPVSLDQWAALQVPHPMSSEMWEQMMKVLEAMKPGIVDKASQPKYLLTEHGVAVASYEAGAAGRYKSEEENEKLD